MIATASKTNNIDAKKTGPGFKENPIVERAIGTLAMGAYCAKDSALNGYPETKAIGVIGLSHFIHGNTDSLHSAISVLKSNPPQGKEARGDLLAAAVEFSILFDGGAYKPDLIPSKGPKMNLVRELCLIEQRLG